MHERSPSTALRINVPASKDTPVRQDGRYVLYWMIAARRTRYNFGLDRALSWARELNVPVLIFEPLRAGYRWASVRHHQFVVEGMRDNAERLAGSAIGYFPYVEPKPGDGRGLLESLASQACVVVTDEYPCFFLPRMVKAAADKLDVRLEMVDSNGIFPLRASERAMPRAHSFRRFLHKKLRDHLVFPLADPLVDCDIPRFAMAYEQLTSSWQPTDLGALDLSRLPIEQGVGPADKLHGGELAGREILRNFVSDELVNYSEKRNKPEANATSGLSPWLHFGHVSAHEVFAQIIAREKWDPDRAKQTTKGERAGWWGMETNAEQFLDELITWRELGYHFCHHRPDDYFLYESLPDWARQTLAEHEDDPRPHCYSLDELENGRTHDPLWNAAQGQLVREGRIHNYMRMLWGKKILHWSPSPREALKVLIELNNKYAVDGRDPNSYSGIFWVLGRFDRAWGPERPIFGKIRYMTSKSTASKFPVKNYVARYTSGQLSLS